LGSESYRIDRYFVRKYRISDRIKNLGIAHPYLYHQETVLIVGFSWFQLRATEDSIISYRESLKSMHNVKCILLIWVYIHFSIVYKINKDFDKCRELNTPAMRAKKPCYSITVMMMSLFGAMYSCYA